MFEQTESDVINELRADNRRLTEDLDFERNLNNILENIRNNSLVLIQNCFCPTNETTINAIKQLNTFYTDFKTKQNILRLTQIQNEVKRPQKEDNLRIESQNNQKSIRSSRTSCEMVRSDDNLNSDKNKRIKTIEINTNLKSNYNLVTEMLGLKEKTSERDNNSDNTEELSNDINQVIEAIDCKPSISSYLMTDSSPGPSFDMNELLSASEEVTNQSNDHFYDIEDLSQELFCNVCNLSLKGKLRLQNHLWRKHGIRSFECDVCDYKTYSDYHLRRHKTSHTSDKPFKCSIEDCDKSFKTKEHLSEHLNLKHSDGSPFICQICNFKTCQRATFNHHKRLHVRHGTIRPFKCNVFGCNKAFFRKMYLESHKTQFHKKSN